MTVDIRNAVADPSKLPTIIDHLADSYKADDGLNNVDSFVKYCRAELRRITPEATFTVPGNIGIGFSSGLVALVCPYAEEDTGTNRPAISI